MLYVALARALGLPARTAVGLVHPNGRFYYHAWPEVWLDGWVAVDPTLDQYPADATHLRFLVGGLARQVELIRLIGRLDLEIVSTLMIRLEGLSKRYGSFTAVHPLDLHVGEGELFGFLGPNGAGKTTTIRMLTGVLRPVWRARAHRRARCGSEPSGGQTLLGYIPDRPFLYEKLTGEEFLRFVSGLWGQEGPAVEARARSCWSCSS